MKNSISCNVATKIILYLILLSGSNFLNAQNCNLVAGFSYSVLPNGALSLLSTATGTNSNTQYYWRTSNPYYYVTNSGPSYSNNPTTFTFFTNVVTQIILTVSTPFSVTPFCADSIVQTISVNNVTCTPMCSFVIQKVTNQNYTWNLIPTFPANLTGVTWDWGDGTFSNAMFPSHTYSAPGIYGIRMTTSVSCTSLDFTAVTYSFLNRPAKEEVAQPITINVLQGQTTSVNSIEDNNQSFSIFPNPNNSNFSINLNGFEIGKEVLLSVCNILGEEVYSEKFVIDSGTQTKKLELSEAKSGTYFVKMNDNNQLKVTKLLIVK